MPVPVPVPVSVVVVPVTLQHAHSSGASLTGKLEIQVHQTNPFHVMQESCT